MKGKLCKPCSPGLNAHLRLEQLSGTVMGFASQFWINSFLFGARIFRLKPKTCCIICGRGHDWRLWASKPWVSTTLTWFPSLLPSSPSLFKLEIFPLISLIRWLCKWLSLRKSHFPALTNLMVYSFTSLSFIHPITFPDGPHQPAVVLFAQKMLLSLKLVLLQALHDPGPRLTGQGNLPYVHSRPSEAADLGDPNSTCFQWTSLWI